MMTSQIGSTQWVSLLGNVVGTGVCSGLLKPFIMGLTEQSSFTEDITKGVHKLVIITSTNHKSHL